MMILYAGREQMTRPSRASPRSTRLKSILLHELQRTRRARNI